LAGGLEYLRLKKYPWIPLFLTVTILYRLEKPVLLIASFFFTAYAKAGSSVACALEGLDSACI